MEADIRHSELSSRAIERETAASAEQWSNWTTNEIRSAIEAERERTFELLAELLAQIQRDVIPETVATLPALRGPAGPVGPPGKLPIAKEWTRETVYYEGSVVTYDGGSYQALRDTGESPDNETHWRCLAAPGRDAKSIRHRGTFTEGSDYAAYDAVALNGGSFLALRDKPGPCPGPGWQLLAAPGKRGVAGERGPQGDRGSTGAAGLPGKDAAVIVCWTIDRAAYTVTPIMSDGSSGPPVNLRGLFEQFQDEVG
jgi:hypothetical protein